MNPNVVELARLFSYPLRKRWHYEWEDVQADLGFTFPTEYKEFVSYFPPGLIGGVLIPVHPGLRQSGLTLPERIRLHAEVHSGWPNAEHPPMPFYPEPGGLIPWADHEGDEALCWLAEGDDPDQWPVFAASARNQYERIPGTTIPALIAVLRSEAGQSVFSPSFYERVNQFGDPFEFTYDEGPSGDVLLPEPEPIDPPEGEQP